MGSVGENVGNDQSEILSTKTCRRTVGGLEGRLALGGGKWRKGSYEQRK